MRIWTIHPKYLDSRGLIALWREALLAQRVLCGLAKGYKNHPQLVRFKTQKDPVAVIAAYLRVVYQEGVHRGYKFDISKIGTKVSSEKMRETCGQLLYEWNHLKGKLKKRSPETYMRIEKVKDPEPNPIFKIIPGEVRMWEKQRYRHGLTRRT